MIIAIVGRKNGQAGASHDNLQRLILDFASTILKRGHLVQFENDTCEDFVTGTEFAKTHINILKTGSFYSIRSTADLCVVMGGDGTMLNAAKEIHASSTSTNHRCIPILGINLGNVGFITDIPKDFDHDLIIDMIEKSEYIIEPRVLIQTSVKGKYVSAMNDIVVSRSTGKILEFQVFIDDQYAYTARGDGLMVATPTGSTAYALSAGGPIMHPSSKVLEVIPILPQSLSCRPLIVNDTSTISFVLKSGIAEVFGDGNEIGEIRPGDSIYVTNAHSKINLVHPMMPELTYSYYKTLSEKLNWHFVPGTPR